MAHFVNKHARKRAQALFSTREEPRRECHASSYFVRAPIPSLAEDERSVLREIVEVGGDAILAVDFHTPARELARKGLLWEHTPGHFEVTNLGRRAA